MKIFQVDAFTDKAFSGNPAAICILDELKENQWMQNVAREMNLSETAFLIKEQEGYNLRWFTPETEVELCGHATLASAHILWENGHVSLDKEITFYTKSGELRANLKTGWIELDFPREEAREIEAPNGLIEALKVKPIFVGKNRFDYLIEVSSEEELRFLEPDFSILSKLPSRGVLVTVASQHKEYDFISRCFFPAIGINEDAVTGSAHCCLGPYWGEKLKKPELFAFQASKRGGTLRVKLEGDRVFLGGKVVTVFCGNLLE